MTTATFLPLHDNASVGKAMLDRDWESTVWQAVISPLSQFNLGVQDGREVCFGKDDNTLTEHAQEIAR